jgi:hypothetical protein
MQIRPSVLEIPADDPFKNDCLSRKELEPPLTQFVTQAIGPFVLAVDGSWGSGKTTFLKMWQVKLEEAGHLCLHLNAWKSDFVQDPLVAVIGELSIAINANPLLDKDNVRKTIDNIEKKTRSIVKRLIPAGVKIATLGALDLNSSMERELSTAIGAVADSLIQDYEGGKKDIEAFRDELKFLADALQETNQNAAPLKIIIIIDELDRCRPTYAVQLLERIKHLFDVEGVVFLLGIDRSQLSHSIKALYGSTFDASGYLKRFIDLDYRLPEPAFGCYCSSLFKSFGINDLISKRKSQNDYGDLEDLNNCLMYLMSAARMSLRDQEQLVSRLRVVLLTIPTNELLFPVTLSVLLFLWELDRDMYISVMKGSITSKDFLTFIETLPSESSASQALSKMRSIYGRRCDANFYKLYIEGTLIAGINEISNTTCPEYQKYLDIIKERNEDLTSDAGFIVSIVQGGRGLSFAKTDARLNLTSNFVRD